MNMIKIFGIIIFDPFNSMLLCKLCTWTFMSFSWSYFAEIIVRFKQYMAYWVLHTWLKIYYY